jgi:raffinose/stachyose/melibiose transport system permease protein
VKHRAIRFLQYSSLLVFAIVAIYPVFLMITSAFKSNAEIYTHPLALPSSWGLDSFQKVLSDTPFLNCLWNSIFVSVTSVAVVLVISSMAAYYIARMPFRWTHFLYFLFLAGLMIPLRLGILPMFIIYKNLGLLNTPWSLILTYIASGMPFSVFVLVGFFRTLPRELEEAGRIDGCTDGRLLFNIVVPLMRPALATVAVMNFISIWNDFFYPLIFIKSDSLKTIPLAMLSLFGEYETNYTVLFAGLTLSTLPMLVLFFLAARQFMEGLVAGAVKG